MLRKECAGFFHSSRTVNGRTEALYEWRVTTGSRDVARVVARRLGGAVRSVENYSSGRWEVLTESPVAEIVVRKIEGGEIAFSLFDNLTLGEFSFVSGMWNPEQIGKISTAGESNSMRCELRLKPVAFKTRTGLTVLHILPSIKALALGA